MSMMSRKVSLPVLALALAAGCHSGSGSSASSQGKAVAIMLLPTKGSLTVDSPDIKADQPIPDRFSDYSGGAIPTIHWTAPPANTKSLVVLVEDPDAPSPEPYVHWIVYAVPAKITSLGSALPVGALQGTNSAGQAVYMGPRPPQGDPPHHYHFQVFALDQVPALKPGADRKALLDAVSGHVLASGDLVATYQKS